MSTATEGTQGFEDKEIPSLVDASEFRDIDLNALQGQRTTDFHPDSPRVPQEKREQERVRRAAVVNDSGTIEAVENVQEAAARTYNARMTTLVAGSGAFPGDPVQLVGNDPQRQRALISNNSETQSIMVGPLSMIAAGMGFLLPPFNVFDPQVQGEIYACVPVGGVENVQVGVWTEVNA